MKLKLFAFLALLTASVIAQPTGFMPSGLKGKVIDASSGTPMEYANIVLFAKEDSSQAAGVVTNVEGLFEITKVKPGNYYLKVSFIGFDAQTIDDIQLKRRNVLDLGTVKLKAKSYDTDDVVVEAQRAPITYEIDKKVINVTEQLTAASGTAIDILENVPSVTVDIEGNVSLRGSSSFTVLVDGRPTIMDPADILEQIPASSIESIEIITNPSAKYDPEGTAGIMNIIMKKDEKNNFSTLVELNAGTPESYGGQVLVEYKKDFYRLTTGVDYGYRNHDGSVTDERKTTFNGVTSYANSKGDRNRGGDRLGVRTELGLDFSESDFFSIGGRYRYRDFGGDGSRTYEEWSDAQPIRSIYTTVSDRSRSGDQFEIFSNYEHRFAPKDHNLIIEVQFESDDSDEESINKQLDANNIVTSGKKTTEAGPGTELEMKVDYLYKQSEEFKIEAGYKNEIEIEEEETGLYEYSTVIGDYEIQSQFNNLVKYNKSEHAIYAMAGGKLNDLGYQIGLRGEYTGRKIETTNQGEFTIDRFDFFPTLHLSYEFAKGHQFMASYTRRINRPRGWELEPFQTWMDAYNVREGNPALEPEFNNSFEAGYQALFGKTIFSAEAYYRAISNKIERLRSAYGDNITLHTLSNVGNSYAFGTELMLNFNIIKAWNMNLMGNLYNYRIEGSTDEENFDRSSFTWDVRFNQTLTLSERLRIQMNAFYNSPSVSSQGEREAFYMFNAGVRYEIIKGVLSSTLQFRDIFDTGKFEFTSESPTYYAHTQFTRSYPNISLNLRYTFNQQARRQRNPDANGGGDMGDWEGGEQ